MNPCCRELYKVLKRVVNSDRTNYDDAALAMHEARKLINKIESQPGFSEEKEGL